MLYRPLIIERVSQALVGHCASEPWKHDPHGLTDGLLWISSQPASDLLGRLIHHDALALAIEPYDGI